MTTETLPQQTVANITCGIDTITRLCNVFPGFIARIQDMNIRLAVFKKIFALDLINHIAAKSWEDFGHRYLNLGTGNQKQLLQYLFSNRIDLTMPEIPNWKELAESYCPGGELDQEDVRNTCVGFGDVGRWDAYPHSMVWIDRFLLYANNHSIDGKAPLFHKDFQPWDDETKKEFDAYQGDKYGKADNWAMWWNQATPRAQLKLLERLTSY